MSTRDVLNKLTTPTFLDEIHHLLWIEPVDNRGDWDEGWNCRDHALLCGIVAQLLKLTATVIYGKATFVQGPSEEAPPVGLCQTTHAWVGLDGLGFMDLSPRLTRCRDPLWRSWPLQCIAMSRCLPDGIFEMAKSEEDYERRVAAATHLPGRHAIYFGHEYNAVDLGCVSKAFDVVNSPLSVTLSRKYDATIYPKAAIHLFKLFGNRRAKGTHIGAEKGPTWKGEVVPGGGGGWCRNGRRP